MPSDLSPDEYGRMAAVMIRLHADFRQRHGLPPLSSAANLFDRVEALRLRSALNDPAVLKSPRPGIGPVLEVARRILWKTLKPLFDRQTEVNRDLLVAIEMMAVESILSMAQRDREQALLTRIAELEKRLARLPDPSA